MSPPKVFACKQCQEFYNTLEAERTAKVKEIDGYRKREAELKLIMSVAMAEKDKAVTDALVWEKQFKQEALKNSTDPANAGGSSVKPGDSLMSYYSNLLFGGSGTTTAQPTNNDKTKKLLDEVEKWKLEALTLKNAAREGAAKLKEEISKLKEENTNITILMDANSAEITKLTQEVAKWKAKAAQPKNGGNADASQLKYDLAEMAAECEKWKMEASNLQQHLALLKSAQEDQVKEVVQQQMASLQSQIDQKQKEYEQMANKNSAEAQLLSKQKEALEREHKALTQREKELEKRESDLQDRIKQCEDQYAQWQSNTTAPTEDSKQLLEQVHQANQVVEDNKKELTEQLQKTEEARVKLAESEKALQDELKRLQTYLQIVEEQGHLPEAKYYHEFLKAIKQLPLPQKIKCFISYAWQPDKKDNSVLQAKLVKFKEDLTKAGLEVMLDIHNMEGDINLYMSKGIQQSDRVLLICTPRLVARADDKSSATPNNLQKELNEALEKQKKLSNFIVPLILEGDFDTSMSKSLPNILCLDFTKPSEYCERMTSLSPKGLIPMLLGLGDNYLYSRLLNGYKAQVELIRYKLTIGNSP